MGLFDRMLPKHIEFIKAQKLFFVATAPPDHVKGGRINLSPKGTDSFRVLSEDRVVFMNLTGSGNETAAHLLNDVQKRITIMFCSFDENPLILRLYGTGEAIHPGDPRWSELSAMFPPSISQRQIILMTVTSGQTSCGFGVPMYDFKDDRTMLDEWAAKKGEEGIRAYQLQKNAKSIDGLEAGLKQR